MTPAEVVGKEKKEKAPTAPEAGAGSGLGSGASPRHEEVKYVYFYISEDAGYQRVLGCFYEYPGEEDTCEDAELPPEALEGVRIVRAETTFQGRVIFYGVVTE